MLNKILLIGMSVFLVFQTKMTHENIVAGRVTSWPEMLFLAWYMSLVVTGVFAFAGFALPTQKLMPMAYYRVRKPRLLKKVYKTFKVEWFRRFLLATVWRNPEQQKKFFDGTAAGLENLSVQCQKSEFGHLIPFILLVGYGLFVQVSVSWQLGSLIHLVNVLGNLYPIVLQRHHRMRLQTMERLIQRKSSG